MHCLGNRTFFEDIGADLTYFGAQDLSNLAWVTGQNLFILKDRWRSLLISLLVPVFASLTYYLEHGPWPTHILCPTQCRVSWLGCSSIVQNPICEAQVAVGKGKRLSHPWLYFMQTSTDNFCLYLSALSALCFSIVLGPLPCS